jgi:predicted Rossmann fold flavoprotein
MTGLNASTHNFEKNMNQKPKLIIIGGGAAGIFAAANCAENSDNLEVVVLEKTRHLLSKVRISGGGRCNVTHAQFDPRKLTSNYPRGSKELLGPFHRFQPQDTVAWFNRHGVELKTEEDGRIFPITDNSATIINCLLSAAKEKGVDIRSEKSVCSIQHNGNRYLLHLEKQETLECDFLILATGSHPIGHQLASSLGHSIIPPVPSLFTFNIPTSPLLDLSGIAVEDAEISLKDNLFKQRGSLLITHWGFSGPAALKLSAWAARDLYSRNYRTEIDVNWIPSFTKEEVYALLCKIKQGKSKKSLDSENPFQLPINLWKRLLTLSGIAQGSSLGHIPNKNLTDLAQWLTRSSFIQEGKTIYKQEFVTCGGVSLKEIDFKTLESRLVKNLFFSGEILDIDGVTGGFNFQNAWTTAYLASLCISDRTK